MDEIRADTLEEEIRALGPWFHNIHFGAMQTAPDHPLGDYPTVKWRRFADTLPANLAGASVLDIGCNAGFYTLEMKRRGAGRVLGIDHDEAYLAQARFVAQAAGADVEFARMDVWEVGALQERFDIVLFLGVLYHLRHPLLALDLIHEHVADDLLLFQSLMRGATGVAPVEEDASFHDRERFRQPSYPLLHFIEHRYSGDPTNWWAPNRAGAEAMLRSAGFEVVAHPEEEVFLCRRNAEAGGGAVYPATGKHP